MGCRCASKLAAFRVRRATATHTDKQETQERGKLEENEEEAQLDYDNFSAL